MRRGRAARRTMAPCPPNADDVPVLVVGAGPAGLAAAIELARHGVPCLLVERRTRLSSHPRATVLSLRSMELMRAWGLEAEVRARSVADVDWRMLRAETLADAAAGTRARGRLPERRAEPHAQPDGARVRRAGRRRAAAARAPARGAGARVALGTEVTGAGRDRRRRDASQLRDVRTGAASAVHAALRRGRRRRAQRGAPRARHRADRPGRRDGRLHDAVPRAAVGRGRARTATSSTR